MGSTVAVVQGVSQIVHGATLTGGGVLAGTATAETGVGSIVGYGVAVVGAVHGGLVAVNGAVGLVESTGRILNMAKGGGSGKDYTFPDTKGLAKRLGIKPEQIHEVKDDIFIDDKIAPLLKKVGDNPDIGWDEMGNIVLKSKIPGKNITVQTGIPIDLFTRK